MTDSKYNTDNAFVLKHKKFIIDHISHTTEEYVQLLRQSDGKNTTIDPQSKNQIMYILYVLIDIGVRADNASTDNIKLWVMSNIPTASIEYKIYQYVSRSITHLEYKMEGHKVEEYLTGALLEKISCEEINQHIVEMFLLFCNVLAQNLANFAWQSSKKVTSVQTNSILRNIDRSGVNPDLFNTIYDSAYSKTSGR
jgi:hypothetical protein